MSLSLRKWKAERLTVLGELDAARKGLDASKSKRGRRFAVQQIHQAYVLLLASHFQGFCRDLHDECADFFVQTVPSGLVRNAVRIALVFGRKLDSGNANPGNLGSDFGRFGLAFWPAMLQLDERNEGWKKSLDAMNIWRNAVAHQHFDPTKLGGTTIRLPLLREWRGACDGLAATFDGVMRSHLETVNGSVPW